MEKTKKILKYSIIGGIFLVPFIPFIVPSTMFFPFITGKGFTFRILVEILFGLFVVLSFIDREYIPKFSWITKAILFFILTTFIADIFGVNPYKSFWSNYERMEGFVLIAHLGLYFIVLSSVLRTKELWLRFFNTSIVASVLMSFYSILQLLGRVNINQGSVRVDATFGNATYMAIYLVFHIFLSLYMLSSIAKEKWQKWLYGAVAILEIIILYFTATRGAILGLIGGLFLTGTILIIKGRENVGLRKFSYSLLGAVALVILVFFSIRGTEFARNNPVLSRFTTLSFSELRTQGRYFVWPMAIKGFVERPILGWGQEGFNFIFNKYYDPRMYAQEQWFDRTHNVFLDWLIAGGLLGFIGYISMYVALLYYILKKGSSFSLTEKSVLVGMISAYVFHNIFVFDNLISYIMFFSILAFVHSLSSSNADISKRISNKTASADTVAYIVFPVTLVVTMGLIYFVNVPALSANKTLIKALTPSGGGIEKNLEYFKEAYSHNSFADSEITEQIVQTAVQVYGSQGISEKTKLEFVNMAKIKIDEKLSKTPNDARYLVFAGSFLNRIGKYDDAIEYLERAVQASPKKQTILFELGNSYIGKGDLKKAFQIFKEVYELESSSSEAGIIYAIGAIYTGNNTVLKELESKISADTIINDDRFIKAYSDVGDVSKVITILNTRLERDPKSSKDRLSLASVYLATGQKQMAIDIINKMILDDPTFKTQGEKYIQEIMAR